MAAKVMRSVVPFLLLWSVSASALAQIARPCDAFEGGCGVEVPPLRLADADHGTLWRGLLLAEEDSEVKVLWQWAPLLGVPLHAGDVIRSVDGSRVESIEQLKAAVERFAEGESFELVVERGGSLETLRATRHPYTEHSVRVRKPAPSLH